MQVVVCVPRRGLIRLIRAHTFVILVSSQLFDKIAISQSCKSVDSDRVINVTMAMKRICMQTGHSGNVTSIFALCRFVWEIIIATHVLLLVNISDEYCEQILPQN